MGGGEGVAEEEANHDDANEDTSFSIGTHVSAKPKLSQKRWQIIICISIMRMCPVRSGTRRLHYAAVASPMVLARTQTHSAYMWSPSPSHHRRRIISKTSKLRKCVCGNGAGAGAYVHRDVCRFCACSCERHNFKRDGGHASTRISIDSAM